MSERKKILERQASWQKSRSALTWPEKIRLAEAVRESAAQLRRSRAIPLGAGEVKPSTTHRLKH